MAVYVFSGDLSPGKIKQITTPSSGYLLFISSTDESAILSFTVNEKTYKRGQQRWLNLKDIPLKKGDVVSIVSDKETYLMLQFAEIALIFEDLENPPPPSVLMWNDTDVIPYISTDINFWNNTIL